jgi:RHS repeat-associated protein
VIDERLPGSTSYNPIFDAQGNMVALLNTSGALVQTVRYGPYGENAKAEGSVESSATTDPFLFQGGYHMAGGNAGAGGVANNLYHFGARYYDPTIGRWTQVDPLDPVRDAIEGDRYSFVGDDPINALDSSGLCSSLIHCIEDAADEVASGFEILKELHEGKTTHATELVEKLEPVKDCYEGGAEAHEEVQTGLKAVDVSAIVIGCVNKAFGG